MITKIAEFLNKNSGKNDTEPKTNSHNESTEKNKTNDSTHQEQSESEQNEKIPQKVIEAWKFVQEQMKTNKTQVQELAVKLLRERLVSIGYLNLLSTSPLLETKSQNPSTSSHPLSQQQNIPTQSIDDENMNNNKSVDTLSDLKQQKCCKIETLDSTTTTSKRTATVTEETTSTPIIERTKETKTLFLAKMNSTSSRNNDTSDSTLSTTASSNIINQTQTNSTSLSEDIVEEEIVAMGNLQSVASQNMSSISSIPTEKTNSLSNSFSPGNSSSLKSTSDAQNVKCSFTTSLQLAALESSNVLNSALKLFTTPSSKSLLPTPYTTISNTSSNHNSNRTPFGLRIHTLALINHLLSSIKIPLPKLHISKSTPTPSIGPHKSQFPTKRRPFSQLSSSQINSRHSQSRSSPTQCNGSFSFLINLNSHFLVPSLSLSF
jgi:hypothetical protein